MNDLDSRLATLGAAGQTITYGALARELGLRIGELTAALEHLMEQDAAAGQPFRAALCEGRLSGGLPARGFFLKAQELGAVISDETAFVDMQRTALRNFPPVRGERDN